MLEVVNHVEGTIPVLNMAHIHARGHGSMRTSEDYGELFDQVRETIGTKEFYCHFSGVDHRGGNAQFYTQIKKSDLNFEPLAEFIVEDGGWLDITLISDSPLLEHDAMYMLQSIEKSRHKQIERRRVKTVAEPGPPNRSKRRGPESPRSGTSRLAHRPKGPEAAEEPTPEPAAEAEATRSPKKPQEGGIQGQENHEGQGKERREGGRRRL